MADKQEKPGLEPTGSTPDLPPRLTREPIPHFGWFAPPLEIPQTAYQRGLSAAVLASNGLTETPLPLRVTAGVLLQTVIIPGAQTDEGKLIEAVALPWFEIIELLRSDPIVAFQIPPEKWEEIIAGAYKKAGFDEVTLTPRSGDHGRDVIAVKRGLGSIRI